MVIEIVSFLIKHGDFPVRYVKLLEGITKIDLLLFQPAGEAKIP